MPQIVLQNSVEAWVSTTRAAKFGDARLYVHSNANAYLFFSRPKLPSGAIITSAVLSVIPGQSAGSSSITINLHHLTSSFNPSSMTWTEQPTVGSLVTSVTRPWYNSGAPIMFTVTSEMQNIVNGGQWFGWRVSTTSADATQWFNSGQSLSPMTLTIEYQSPPSAPTDLYPNSNRIVNDPKPTLAWVSQGGLAGDQLSFQVQVAADAGFTTSLYTSNEIPSGSSSYDLTTASPTFTALTAGQSRYWRVRVKNSQNVWSPYSAAARFTYQASIPVTITAPSGASTPDPTPTVTWTYGGTQQAYQVLVTGPRNGTDPVPVVTTLYNSGILYGATLSHTIPVGVILWPDKSYTVSVRVWSTDDVVSVTGTPNYDTGTKTFIWDPTGATPAVDLEITQEVNPLPARLVRWQYTDATPAQSFILTRTRYGKVEAQWNLTATAVREGATTWYRYVDRTPAGRSDVTYEVRTRWADGQTSSSAFNPIVTVHLDHIKPWIISTEAPTSRAFCLLNYEIDSNLTEISDVIEPVGGPAYLTLQKLGKSMGSASGLISWEANPGSTTFDGEDMRANFMWIRESSRRVYMLWADEAIEAFIYNMKIDPVSTANGKTDYAVSFNFVEV